MDIIERIKLFFILLGNPGICLYHVLLTNPFLNIAADDAQGLEKYANYMLTPVRYVLDGKKGVPHIEVTENGEKITYHFEPQFDYYTHFFSRATAAVTALPFSLAVGIPLKALSFFSPNTREKHQLLCSSLHKAGFVSNLEKYRSLGIEVNDFTTGELSEKPKHKRRAEDDNHLLEERKIFKEIVAALKKYQIPFWLDCGTCLGAYRYGGCIPWDIDYDFATLKPDFNNVLNALSQELDPSLCKVFDFSGRDKPGTYIRVLVKSTGTMIDIYSFDIDAEKKVVTEILSTEFNIFLTEKFKMCEKRFTKPIPFDYIFPLKRGVFEGLEVPLPNKIVPYLQTFYGENLEPVKIYNEATGDYEKDLSHPYWKLPGV